MTRVAKREGERGAALVEFALCATLFLTVVFGVLEFGRMLWVHNALADATRRAARYAVTRGKSNEPSSETQQAIKNVAVYGNPEGSGNPLVDGLAPGQVLITFSDDYGLGAGSVLVEIDKYEFRFVVPLLGTKMQMPAYRTALTSESAGFVPDPI
ncbi:MAG TPA: TadE family protein [Pyrinomonadaceae bacterium]|nr:TadE family protein [Pyrinomonadaceae bacterium]